MCSCSFVRRLILKATRPPLPRVDEAAI
jgi:hypothetical protein